MKAPPAVSAGGVGAASAFFFGMGRHGAPAAFRSRGGGMRAAPAAAPGRVLTRP